MAETKIVSDRLSDTLEFEFNELALGDGTVGTPSLAFTNDQDTGLYLDGTNVIGFAGNGNTRMTVGSSLIMGTNVDIRAIDGSDTAPGYTFGNDTNTGMYRVSTDELGFATAGLTQWRITSGGIFAIDSTDNASGKVLAGVGSTTNPTYSFNEAGRTDDGMFSPATSELGFAINGTERTRITNLQLLTPDGGTNANPSIANIDDPDTGLLWLTGSINFVVDGNQIANFADGQAGFDDGSAATPGIAFLLDTDTGMYRISADRFGFAAGGSTCADFTVDRLEVPDQYFSISGGTAAAPAYAFSLQQNSGMYVNTSNGDLQFAEGGARVLFMNQTGIGIDIDGTASVPAIRWANDSDMGIFRSASNNLSFAIPAGGNFNFYEGGVARWRYDGGGDHIVALADNDIALGNPSLRWSDVRSVLINGSDIGFANGYIMREYPATEEDVQTKSDDWMKENANLGIQILNDLGERIAVIHRDGTIYAKDFKNLSELPA